jgi:ribosomal protein L7Ae-like RNA K-turn-binding protein
MAAPDAALRLLGIAARAGAVVTGTERVRMAARGGEVRFAIVAGDASDNSREKLLPLLTALGVPLIVAYDRDALGIALGRGGLSAVGVTDTKLANRLRELSAG